jgi:type I restriction enzyme S subunit
VSFPTYRNYKPSGELWLGQVPAHWTLRRLGFYFIERRQKVSDKVFKPLSVSKAGIVPQIETAAKTDDGDNRKRVNRGDFVINSRSDRKGSAGVSELEGSVSLINTVLIPQEPVCMRFIHHLFRSVPFQEEYYRHGKGIVADLWSTNFSEMKNICLSMPPSSEQEQIASFLDQETSKIDALVSEQQRLIELLKEKRQAVISHAVTKGLNPDVRMKPSGVEWLAEVPEQWEVFPLKTVTSCNDDVLDEKTNPDYEILYVDISSVDAVNGVREKMAMPFSEAPSRARRQVKHGDVIVSTVRTYLRAIACIQNPETNLIVSTGFAVIRPKLTAVPEFLGFLMSSNYFMEQVISRSTGVSYPAINASELVRIQIALPPIEVQAGIASFLKQRLAQLDRLKEEAEKAIGLFQERRSSLISAAVTGKIDVRNYAVTQKDAA